MEFGRRLAQEKEVDRSEFKHCCNLGEQLRKIFMFKV